MERNKKIVAGNKKTCGVDVTEANKTFAFGVVSDVEVPGVLLIDKMNNVDVSVLVLNNNIMGKKRRISDAELPGVGIHDVEVPSVGLKKRYMMLRYRMWG